MAKVICNMGSCVHRSKRPLKKWRYQNGSPCYGCKLETIGITRISDPDGDCRATISEGNMAHCSCYEPEEKEEELEE